MDKAKLVELLQASQIPDTDKVKAVTAELQKNYLTQPECLLLLIEIAITHEDAGIRQLASVQALRITPKHWPKIPEDKKDLARKHLLEGAVSDQTNSSRHSKCRLLAGMIGLDLENSEGQAFLGTILSLSGQDSVAAREVGSYLLYAVLENDPTHFSEQITPLLQHLKKTIRDPASGDVRLNSARAVGALLMLIEPDEDPEALSQVQEFAPPMVQILKDAVDKGNEDHYKEIFQVFQSFLAYDSALLAKHLKDLIQFMIELAQNTEIDDDARSQALAFLSQCARYRRMKIQAMKDMGAQLMIKSMEIVTEIDDDDDEDEMSPARTALALIDQLASDLPPRQVIIPLLDEFPKFARHENPGYRKAAILSLGTAAEGAPDFISTQLQPLLPIIINLLNDPEGSVRHAALVGLIHLAEEMADELIPKHEELIAGLLKNLEAATQSSDKKNISIIRAVCGALDSLVGEGFEADVMRTYGPKLIIPMGKLLSHDDYGVKAAAGGAIGALAMAMGDEAFQPYFKQVMEALGQYAMIQGSEEEMGLRSSVCDAMGRIAGAVGPEAFQPYVVDLMKASEEALSFDNARLKETSFILWASLSKVYGEQFDHFLPGVFKGLSDCLELEEEEITIPGVSSEDATDGVLMVGGRKIKLKAADDEDEEIIAMGDDDEWDDLEEFTGVTAIALEQEIALEVLGDIITHSCNLEAIKTYLEPSMKQVLQQVEHAYEGSRKAAISTLWRAYARVWQLMEQQSGVKWQAGIPLKHTPDASLLVLGQMVTKATLPIWANDMERSVITEINRNVAATLKACGPAILTQENMLQESVTVLSTIITRSHPCQQDLGDEEDEQEVEEGSSEFDWLVIDTALDVVLGLATALGPDFSELWKVFERPVMKFASSQESLERSTAVGVIAEAIKYMEAAVSPFTSTILPVVIHRLSDEDTLTKSNAAYATGQLLFNSTQTDTTLPEFPAILRKLEPLLRVEESRMVDNVSGCLCRMIMVNPNPGFIEKVLQPVVQVLPLKEDYEENAPIYKCIFGLYEQGNSTVQQLTPQILPILQKVLGPPEEQLDSETREVVTKLVQILQR